MAFLRRTTGARRSLGGFLRAPTPRCAWSSAVWAVPQHAAFPRARGVAVATSSSDPALGALLASGGPVAAATSALERFGRYGRNEVAWQHFGQQLLEHPGLRDLQAEDLKRLVRVLAEGAAVTQKSFWDGVTERVAPALERASFEDLLELADMYAKIQAWQKEIFDALVRRVRADMAMHWMEPGTLVRLLAVFSRAGSSSRDLGRTATQLFNEMEERVLDRADDFAPEDCVVLLESMARFRAAKLPVLRQLGRECLHEGFSELPGPQISAICDSYGMLGWRHDTVFRSVAGAVLEEHELMQKARVLQETLPSLRYSGSDIALVALAMLRLKMYRGNTAWFAWTDRYDELLDVLTQRLDDELPTMQAKPLAAAAFVLGRARRGTEELHRAMFLQMQKVLEGAADAAEPPQDHLEQFLHGLVMMGPTRKKDLDTTWLMEWLCAHLYTLVLSDFVSINRHLVMLGCFDRQYLIEVVKFYCRPDVMRQLKKSDVMELTHTYNGARIREDDMPEGHELDSENQPYRYGGKHFFWAIGRQFQKLTAEASGPRRSPLRRLG